NLIAHAILGALEARITGNNAVAGALGALTAEVAAPYIMKTLYGTDNPADLSDSQKQNVANLSQIAAGLSGGLVGDSTSNFVAGAEIGKRAVENNALTNKYSYELLDDKEKALFDKLKANGVKDVDQFEAAFNQAKTQEERDQIIAEYKEAVAAANQIIANLYKQGVFTDEDYSLFISSYSQKMLEGAKQGQIENNGKSQLSFWGTLSESDPYLFYGTEWFIGNQLNNEQLKSVRNQYWDKQVEKGVITPAERELILAKDNAYTAYLPIARPDEVKNFVKALLSDDISTLQLLTKGHIATPKKSTVEKQNITCTTACFVAGTLVETARGLIPIEQIGFGDLIWSREEFGNHYAYKPVTATKATDNQQLVEVIVENEQGQQETYLTTTEHPFYVEGIGWLKSTLLSSEMKLLDRNGSASLKVVSQNVLDRYATVYNIMVDDHHTYHIGELGVWVHNDQCCKVYNMGEFFELNNKFSKELKDNSQKSEKKYDGMPVYKITKRIDRLSKGDQIYLDNMHNDHFEVFDRHGEFKFVLNLDGSINESKTAQVLRSKNKRILK
ncbi:polymorphic toxin-type HINT domain-containing protein, partial [Ursidibacter sp. B-7004-1]